MKTRVWFLMGVLIASVVDARYIPIKHERDFSEEINRFEFAVVCFLDASSLGKKDQMKELKKMVAATSDTQPYDKLLKHEVGFLVVDAGKDSVRPLLKKYGVAWNSMPQFLLFHNAKAVSNISEQIVRLIGFICKADLLDFIDDYFGKALDDILSVKAEQKQDEKEMQIARYQAYAASRYPYGMYAPYNAYGQYSWYGYRAFYENGGYWGNTFYIP